MEKKDRPPHINVDYFEDLTGDLECQGREPLDAIGRRLKTMRQERELSLEELARRTGFDAAFLAEIENNEAYPQLGTVIKLSKALDAAFGQVLCGAGDKPYVVTRVAERKPVSRSTSQKGTRHIYSYKGLAPEVQGRHMEPLIVQLKAQAEKEISSHDGEEFVYVINGTVLLELGEDHYELQPGDSAYYLSQTPHWITAKDDEATILAVIYNQ
ncbi:MAG: XRE family transcriptional regulator [Desulfobacterales bacterium]